MLQLLYDFVNWQYFGILAIIWIVIDLFWVDRWQSLLRRLGKIITKPWVFEKDKEPDDPILYPRRIFEQLALNSRREQKDAVGVNAKNKNQISVKSGFQEWLDGLRERVFDSKNPIRSIGYVIALTFFVFFLIADAITIANTMVLIGVISPDLPPLLQRLDLAILGGALLTAIVGVWMLIEMSGTGELVNTDQLSDSQKKIYKIFAVTVTLFSGAVMVALAVQRLISLGSLESSPTTDLILSFILYGLLAINNSLSAALTFQPTASGLVVLIYLLIEIIILLLPILAFLLDVLWRVLYVVLDIAIWMLLTPIIAIPYGIGKIFGWI